jgi:alpha-tubulin suppressor-like RCC1 family protein
MVYSFGWNGYGQLGLGDIDDRHSPVQITAFTQTVTEIACGQYHSLAITGISSAIHFK